MATRDKDSYSIQAVENALNILEALGDEGEEIRISQLSQKLGLNKTSVFRLMATFENRGYVEQERESGKYRLGLSAYEIAQKFLSRNTLLLKARPVMERLARDCNESVYAAVRREGEILFLDVAETAQQVKIASISGRRLPLHSCAAGKVILAHAVESSPGNGELSSRPLPSPLAEELQAIRTQGACVDQGTIGDQVVCAAVPLFNGSAGAAGSLCLVGPAFRLTAERLESEILPRLKDAGEVISSKLGYLAPHFRNDLL